MLTKRLGIASDHGGYYLKEYLKSLLEGGGYEVIDFGNPRLEQDDDYPDYVVPMAMEVSKGNIDRGIAICGSGVGACVAVNKIKGIRSCLICDTFSAHQGVEDDNMNIICLGGRITGNSLAWELVRTFLAAEFTGELRHRRRLAKISGLESQIF